MRKRLSILIALAAAVMIAVATVMPAFARPSYLNLTAGSCYGAGQSYLNYPGGGASTSGCANSARYLVTSIEHANQCAENYSPGWQTMDIVRNSNPNQCAGAVVTWVSSTHNLQYITAQNGFVDTNTW